MYYRLQGYDANPHLKPEEMQAVEIGASMHSSRFTAHTTLWHHHGRNMIDWILDTRQGTGATWQSVNHTRLNSMGMEATIQLSLSNSHTLSLSYGYSHQEKDLESGLVSQYAMEYLRHKLVAKAALPLAQHLLLYATLRWQDRNGQYTDFDGNACDYKPYWLADTRLVWKKSCYEIFVEANNLLNNRYRDYGLVEQPGRWIIGGIKIAY
jgi:iron complex outermembrane receptor protein